MQPVVSNPVPEEKHPLCLPLLLHDLEELRDRCLGLALLDLLLTQLLLGESRGVWVQAQHDLLVLERVLLLHTSTLRPGLALGAAQDALYFGAVDQTGKVRLGNDVGGQEEVLLHGGGLGGGAVDLVEGLEGGRGPDDETTEVTTGSQLQQVQGVDGAGLDTGDVAEALDKLLAVDLGVVDDKRAAAVAVAATSELALTGSELLGALDLLQLGTSTDSLQETDSSRSLGDSGTIEGGGVDDERDLGDGHDLVATGKEERRDGGGSQSGSGSEAPINLSA